MRIFKIMFENRNTYRKSVDGKGLVSFKVTVKETDLLIHAQKNLKKEATEIVLKYRGYIEAYIQIFPEFANTLVPWANNHPAHEIIRKMSDAGKKAGVGPMASIAGAIAEYTGRDLLLLSDEVIIENGGDTFIHVKNSITIGIYAGSSPLSMKIGLKFNALEKPFSVCTSSGTIGHSLSLGKSDAVCVISDSALIADAAATSIGNRVKSNQDISTAIDFGKNIEEVNGIVVVSGDKLGMWGDINIVKLKNT